MANNISPTGGSPVNKIALVAKSAVSGKREITDAKKEAKRIAADLEFIRDKARGVSRGKSHSKIDPKKKNAAKWVKENDQRLGKLIESVAEMGLAQATPEGEPLNDYQKIGSGEAALQVIGGIETHVTEIINQPEDPWIASEPFDLDQDELQDEGDADIKSRQKEIYRAAGEIAGDESVVKEPQGLRKRLTGTAAKTNAEHTAQRTQMLEQTGLEAIAQVAQADDLRNLNLLLVGGAQENSPHTALKAIGQFGELSRTGARSFDAGRTRTNLKSLQVYYRGAALQGRTEESRQAANLGRMIENTLRHASRQGDKAKENGEYFGALAVIEHYHDHAGESKDKLIAGCAQAVLKEPIYEKLLNSIFDERPEINPDYKYQTKSRAQIRPYEPTGGVVALKTLAKELKCETAQKILESKKSDRAKLQLLKNLDK